MSSNCRQNSNTASLYTPKYILVNTLLQLRRRFPKEKMKNKQKRFIWHTRQDLSRTHEVFETTLLPFILSSILLFISIVSRYHLSLRLVSAHLYQILEITSPSSECQSSGKKIKWRKGDPPSRQCWIKFWIINFSLMKILSLFIQQLHWVPSVLVNMKTKQNPKPN